MGDNLPSELRTFFEPQAEQLSIPLRSHPFGLIGRSSSEDAESWLWVAALGEHCLLSAHGVVPKQPFDLEEHPTAYACITSVSAATARECAPSAVPRRIVEQDNLLAFSQPAGATVCRLQPGRVYAARNICLTPGFFASLERRYGKRFGDLAERFSEVDPDLLPLELRSVLASVDPAQAARPGAALLMEARVDEAVFLLMATMEERRRARQDEGAASQRDLVRRARHIIDADLSAVPPLDDLARALYVSRARLCAAFKQETGFSVGAYVRARRMERARDLLARTALPVAAIAREVGYSNPGSFTEAFERETGRAPSVWRSSLHGD